MRKAPKKLANNAAWTTNQLSPPSERDKTYEDKYGIHLFKPFFFAFVVDDLHPCLSVLGNVSWCGWILAFIIVFPGSFGDPGVF